MKRKSIYFVAFGIVLIWGLFVSQFFPLLHLGLTWLIILFITILIVKFSIKIYVGIIFSFVLVFLDNTLWRLETNLAYDDLGRDFSFMSFFISSSIVCVTWGISLFSIIKKRLNLAVIQVSKTYFSFLIFTFILSSIIYIIIYRAWFFQ